MEKSEPLPGVISRHFLSHRNICYLVYFCKSLSSDDQRAFVSLRDIILFKMH